ncbi:MAG TPA: DUF3786 domain-containing protein [Deltaproteobacteria bacterium]|nr:DUF3786 domain-containing protein [Deltaproteobacteria bacterium]
MTRMDDYIEARKIAVETLKQQPLADIIRRSGFESDDDGSISIRIPFLDRTYRVGYPKFEFGDVDDETFEIPIQEQVLILHYLLGVTPFPLTGDWVPYREIPGASLYHSVFVKRAADPLKKVFGRNVSGFSRTASQLNGGPVDFGDAAFEFLLFPRVPIQLILHEGDEEFPSEAIILFDRSISRYLSPEDIAWLAGMLVYRLIALSHSS